MSRMLPRRPSAGPPPSCSPQSGGPPRASARPMYPDHRLMAPPGTGQHTAGRPQRRRRRGRHGYSPATEAPRPWPASGAAGVIAPLGKLAKAAISRRATAINSLGAFVGDGDTGNFRPQGWVTTAAGLDNFFSNNGGNTHTIAINDAGAIGGYYTRSLSRNVSAWRGAIWTPDPKDPRKYRQADLPRLIGLDPTFKGTAALPTAFNQQGQAAGYAQNEVIGQPAACAGATTRRAPIVDLGVFPGDWSSLAWGLNNLGQVVGESHPPAGKPTSSGWTMTHGAHAHRAAAAAGGQLQDGHRDQQRPQRDPRLERCRRAGGTWDVGPSPASPLEGRRRVRGAPVAARRLQARAGPRQRSPRRSTTRGRSSAPACTTARPAPS